MKSMRVLIVFIVMSLAVCVLPAAGHAQSRITVDPGRIGTHVPLIPGESYTLPTHAFINDTVRDLRVTVSTSDYEDEVRSLPPKDWFTIEPTEAVVDANSSGEFQVTVSLPANAPAGDYRVWFRFSGVPVDASGVVVAQSLEVSFVFEVAPKEHTLTLTVSGEGTTEPALGTHTYQSGSHVELAATPDEGWEFSHWQGDVADHTSSQTTVTMNADISVVAVFAEREPVLESLTLEPTGLVLESGERVQLVARGTYYDGGDTDVTNDVTWQSSDESVVTVDSTGAVTAEDEGEATVSAQLGDLESSILVTVTSAVGDEEHQDKDKPNTASSVVPLAAAGVLVLVGGLGFLVIRMLRNGR